MMEIDFVRSRFIKHFDGKTGNVYASPGRINLIGEHTDYNGGFVFPGAVDKGIMAEMRANGTEDTVMAYAIDLKDRVDFHLDDPAGPRASWARYIYGIAKEMQKLGVPVKGFNIAFAGDVPLGAGMSSSAAMESCFACGLNDIFGDNKVSQWDMAAQLLRCQLWYHGPVRLRLRQGRLSDAPRLPFARVRILPLQARRLSSRTARQCCEAPVGWFSI